MIRRIAGCCMVAACLGAAGAGWSEEDEPESNTRPPSGVELSRSGTTPDMETIMKEPLEETLNGIHEFWWSPVEETPWDPQRYVARIVELPRMQKLYYICAQGDSAEKASLLEAVNQWLDLYLYEYPLVSFKGDSLILDGYSAHRPGMDAALTLLLAELDPSRESLARIESAFDRHVEALRHSAERNGLANRPNYDGEHRSQTTNVFCVAGIRLVKMAFERGEAWLMEDAALRKSLESALAMDKTGGRPIFDAAAAFEISPFELNAAWR